MNEKQEVKIPFEIETKVKDAIHYLFLGVDFNKWQNRLLLFCLNLNGEGYSLNNDTIEEINQSFVYQQFKVTSVTANYKDFINALIKECEEKKYAKSLIDTFIENTLLLLDKIRKDPYKENNDSILSDIDSKIALLAVE